MKRFLLMFIVILLIPMSSNAASTRFESNISPLWIQDNIVNTNFDVNGAFASGFNITAAGIDVVITDYSNDNYMNFKWELWSENDAHHFVRRTERIWNASQDLFSINYTFPLELGDITPTERFYIDNLRSTWIYLDKATFWVEGEYNSVPIPGAFWLLGSGLIGLVGFSRKKNSKKI